MFSMDAFVKKFQSQSYNLWKAGRDIAAHPEDPQEVKADYALRAKSPQLYVELKKKQLMKRNENAIVSTFDSNNGSRSTTDPKNTALIDVYQHHELFHVKIDVDPLTMELSESARDLLEDYFDTDNPNIKLLISEGLLIKIGTKAIPMSNKKKVTSPAIAKHVF